MKRKKLVPTATGIGPAMLGRMGIAGLTPRCLRTLMIGGILDFLIPSFHLTTFARSGKRLTNAGDADRNAGLGP